MESKRWRKIESLFHAVREKVDGERAVFLDKACGDDILLRKEVEDLFASSETSDSFLEKPILEKAMNLLVQEQPDMLLGQLFGHFKILSSLGKGGMGEVYLAEDLRLGRKVALKLLPSTLSQDGERLRRFEQEARSASSLSHPNIITVYEIRKENDTPFIALEYVEGVTLRHQMVQAALKLEHALDIAIQVGSALAAAHSAGIIHRDIKPENIMLRSDGLVKVLDFGLAKHIKQIETETEAPTQIMVHTTAGTIIGTANYMSPEQVRTIDVDERTDIWSLGVMLYEMITEHTPFKEETTSDLIAAILKTNPQPLSAFVENIPVQLQQIVEKSLQKNKEKRYQTANDLVQDLKDLKQQLDSSDKTTFNLPSTNQIDGYQSGCNGANEPAAVIEQKSYVADSTDALQRTTSHIWKVPIFRSLAIIFSAALLIGTVATIFWLYTNRRSPEASSQQNASSTAGPKTERELSFRLTVQKMHNNEPFERPFDSSGQEIFKSGDKFWININPPQDGYLYVFNEGPELQSNLPRYTVLVPLYGDSAKVIANQTIESPPKSGPGYSFDQKKGTEKIWIVWSENPVTELEVVKVAANPKDKGFIKDINQVKLLQDFFTKHYSPKPDIDKDSKQVKFKSRDDLLVGTVKLEHQ